MTLDEARNAKNHLEATIETAINEFEAATSMTVDSLELQRPGYTVFAEPRKAVFAVAVTASVEFR